jgi:hypothetical protein
MHPRVVASAAAPGPRTLLSKAGPVPASDDLGDVATLDISIQRNGDETRFIYKVNIEGVALNRFESPPLTRGLESYVNELYADIEAAWTQAQPQIDIFHDHLKATGVRLRGLLPPGLQRLLWKAYRERRLASLLVLSDEPFVPWEIVFLDDPDAGGHAEACFLGELGLCRWLYGAVAVSRINVRPDRAAYVIPFYPDARFRLVNAETVELPMVERVLKARAVTPHYAEVKALLKGDACDLIHFAGHGAAESRSIGKASVLLQGNKDAGSAYVTEPLFADVVASEARLRGADGNRPLVMLNACQVGRLGHGLTSIGGFAPAFLGIREGETEAIGKAGAFVGALWSVGDEPASDFARAFYETLRKPGGATIGEATVAGRKAARDARDGTWLAYAVYAHPNCKVEFVA